MSSTMTRPKSKPHRESSVPNEVSAPLRQPDLPLAVANDEKMLKAWNAATEDERQLGAILYELESRLHLSGIECYFQFAKWWHEKYPKGNKKNYQRGLSAVKGGAVISPFSVPQVYVIIRTISVYTYEAYQDLKQRALANGVAITWTHLRTIANKLGKNEYKRIRHAVENRLVEKKMTEKQLIKLIGEYAPDTVTEAERDDAPGPVKVFKSFVSTMKRNVDKCQDLQNTISQLERALAEDDPEEVKADLQEVLDLFDKMERIIEENRPRLENSLKVVSVTPESEEEQEETVARIAASVTKQMQTGKGREPERLEKEKQRRPQTKRLTLAPGFNDDDEIFDQAPRMTFRDDGDENEFGSLDDDFEEEPDEWNDFEEEADPVFDEIGNIPSKPIRYGPKR